MDFVNFEICSFCSPMQLKKTLEENHSKATTEAIAKWIGNDAARFRELWDLFRSAKPPLPQRAAWVFYYVCDSAIELPQAYSQQFTDLLIADEWTHQAEKRGVAQTLGRLKLTEDQMGQLIDVCYANMLSGTEPIAIKVHCMQVLFNIVQVWPELAGELSTAIQSRMETEGAGFRSRGKRILKALAKL